MQSIEELAQAILGLVSAISVYCTKLDENPLEHQFLQLLRHSLVS